MRALTLLFYPLPLGLVLALIGLALSFRPAATLGRVRTRFPSLRTRVGPALLGTAFFWLWIWSTPLLSICLRGHLERMYPPLDIDAVPSADLIVVLGGVASAESRGRPPDLNHASDRLWHAARLFRAGKAPQVMPVSSAEEMDVMTSALVELGVPPEAIVRHGRSRSTWENGLQVRGYIHSVCGAREVNTRILLVTSALHMRRAAVTFARMGMSVIPAATDHEIPETGHRAVPRSCWPDAESLAASSRAYREYLGHLIYRLKKVPAAPAGGAGVRRDEDTYANLAFRAPLGQIEAGDRMRRGARESVRSEP
jgi:uncharacterized SAM-binding protein YcdF (DUF218 family)